MAGAAARQPPQHQPPHHNVLFHPPTSAFLCRGHTKRRRPHCQCGACGRALRRDGRVQMGGGDVWARREHAAAVVRASSSAATQQRGSCSRERRRRRRRRRRRDFKRERKREEAFASRIARAAAGKCQCMRMLVAVSHATQRPLLPRSGSNGDHKEAVSVPAVACCGRVVTCDSLDDADEAATDYGGGGLLPLLPVCVAAHARRSSEQTSTPSGRCRRRTAWRPMCIDVYK
jgi:hypothetical protein